jgi:hypothetical protein
VREAVEGDFEEWLALLEEVAAERRWIGAEAPVDSDRARRIFEARLNFEQAAHSSRRPMAFSLGTSGSILRAVSLIS